MSARAKLTLATTTLVCAGTIGFVHYTQEADRAAMHAGVIRDMEQQKVKKERQLDFELQQKLEKEYRQLQHVTEGNEDGTKNASVGASKPWYRWLA